MSPLVEGLTGGAFKVATMMLEKSVAIIFLNNVHNRETIH